MAAPSLASHKPRGLRFSRGAAIGCRHGRQPMEWCVLMVLKPQRATLCSISERQNTGISKTDEMK